MDATRTSPTRPDPNWRWPAWLACTAAWAAVWAIGWATMLALDARIDLANKALVMVLTAAVAACWSAPWVSLLASLAAVLAFNFAFVPPRGRLTVDLHQHALLLLTMLAVSWIVALLLARLRWHAARATAHAERSDQLRQFGDTLRAADDTPAQVAALQILLAEIGGTPTALLLAEGPGHHPSRGQHESPPHERLLGITTPDQAAGLRLCWIDGRAMGPGTGRHQEQPHWYLPLRGRTGTHGAVLMGVPEPAPAQTQSQAELLRHAQALCAQLAAEVERSSALRSATAARELAQTQALQNTLLAAISHDHRTPLATILSAASALHDQGERQSPAQRRLLCATIVDEAGQLTRLTDNTLQLARLGARLGSVGLALHRDWESVEELVGALLRRVRQRDPAQRIKLRLEADLPLLRCDAVLMVQLLDNLVDNALKHAGADGSVEVVARRLGAELLIAVRDRGPGVPPAQRERIFEVFQRAEVRRGQATDATTDTTTDTTTNVTTNPSPRRGAGVGLALCRAIARAHQGDLHYRARSHGGASFELHVPLETAPGLPPGTQTAALAP